MKNIYKFSVRDISEIGMLTALAVILDQFVRIKVGATGGSINISMLPLYIIAIRHGWFKGLISGGLIYGLTTNLLDGYNILMFPCDYLIPFGAVAIVGIFGRLINKLLAEKTTSSVLKAYGILLGCMILCMFIRVASSSINSVIFYGVTYIEGVLYNFGYVLPSTIAVAVVLSILLPVIRVINKRFPSTYLK